MSAPVGDATRLRVLYVGINYYYMNLTPILLPVAIGRHAEVHHFGPGFCTAETLAAGIGRFADAIGGFDLVVTTKDFAGDYSADNLNRSLGQFVGLTPREGLTAAVVRDVRQFLARNRPRVLVSMLDSDVYAISQETLDAFDARGGFFIGPSENCVDVTHEELDRETYVSRKRKHARFGLYHAWARATRERRIELYQIVAESEFTWKDLALRPYDVSVPGSLYARRGDVYRHLKSQRDLTLAKRFYEYVFQAANKLRLKPFSNIYLMTLYQLAFQQLLQKSKVCVTDGGMVNYTVRKYFEIPAAGSVLVCWPSGVFGELGFRDKVNCLTIGRADEAGELVREVRARPEDYQHLVESAQKLVLEKHALSSRATQLRASFERIVAGTFCGASWQDGDFALH